MTEKLIHQSLHTEVACCTKHMIDEFNHSPLKSDVFLSNLFGKLTIQYEDLYEAMNQSNEDSDVEEKDLIRDDKIRALLNILNDHMHHPDNNIQKASAKVKQVFDKYGMGMINEGYTIESSIIHSLLKDLDEPHIQVDIHQIPSCQTICDALKQAQQDFENALKLEKSKMIRIGMKESARSIKRLILDTINNQLINYLNSMQQTNNNYDTFFKTIHQIITHSNARTKSLEEKK
ncbi:DUF6261 family protein [Saccharicrinis fermentans]|uniref:Uncharacterized protein n=1 Tax=Saccharicrinis fermentans DSM 9555 = JCM 21142 TaxID=869213 RepID=W7YK47_9BACT|nr:DUF6261 family protein [Saccharicrinis fermentans]GAF04906.1 hypothetical protein JCM21142_93628 [Saccharicrinis fermentans DSM 9555 = JCM 21142]